MLRYGFVCTSRYCVADSNGFALANTIVARKKALLVAGDDGAGGFWDGARPPRVKKERDMYDPSDEKYSNKNQHGESDGVEKKVSNLSLSSLNLS